MCNVTLSTLLWFDTNVVHYMTFCVVLVALLHLFAVQVSALCIFVAKARDMISPLLIARLPL